MAKRYGEKLSLGIIDIDDLKEINDQRGHLAGDEVIQEVADSLKEHTREADLLFRWGGDEFLLILPKTSQEKARQAIKRIRKSLEDKISVSCGVTEWKQDESFESAFERADQLMYEEKNN